MLISLQVKNLALIDHEEIELSEGLNILTGETGAGKSIILGALDLALGGKAERHSLRDTEKDGFVEAVFRITNEKERAALAAMEVETFDDEVILQRKITAQRASAKINGESVPAGKLKEAGEILINIHGQNEHQALLKKSAHLFYLDKYASDRIGEKKEHIASIYGEYAALKKEYEEAAIDDSDRTRELSFLEHEINEIREASLSEGEDALIEEEYRKLSNTERIKEALGAVYGNTGGDAAADNIGRALQELGSVCEYDNELTELHKMLSDAEGILSDFNRGIVEYMDGIEDSGERFALVSARLDLINGLKNKYGKTITDILKSLEEKEDRYKKLNDYDEYLSGLKVRLDKKKALLSAESDELSSIRRDEAKKLCGEIKEALLDLNFLDVRIEMEFTRLEHFTAGGIDEAEFMIALNPGAPLRPLIEVASGGELSRIMLALKTVMAEGDEIDTLIFDEIDAGISGRTASAVAEKLSTLSRTHQIICITHLPQIAAMADAHYLIEKNVEDGAAISAIRRIEGEDITGELARMLGGAALTEAVMENAREMKNLAEEYKKNN
ncbi:MAG: DNA repair protein RecN [Lachnospiraceae bacterium]|nr:DNA repair protein RecN [Lachnospiraceae bacterium]